MTTPQQIEAKAKELHLAFNAMEIRTSLEDMAGAKQKLFSDFLTSFASEVRAETMEADAKICDQLANEHEENSRHGGDEYAFGQADCYLSQKKAAKLIRSNIQL